MDPRSVRSVMTPWPHVVAAGRSLRAAAERMERLGVRHLPVVEGHRVVALLDGEAVRVACEVLGCERAGGVPVEHVARPDPCLVDPDAHLEVALRDMADRHTDCAVVVERGRVVGVFTVTDALRMLADALAQRPFVRRVEGWPSAVRARVVAEHEILRGLLLEAQALARRILDGDMAPEPALRRLVREIYQAFGRHMVFEGAFVFPALHDVDGFGPMRVRQYERAHDTVRRGLDELLGGDRDGEVAVLAEQLLRLVPRWFDVMRNEEVTALSPELWRDDPIQVQFTG